MHELSIANSILEAVRAEAARRPGVRVAKVGVRVGELSGVEPDALSFSFEALVRGSDLEPLALEVETCPRRQRCCECGCLFRVVDFNLVCPDCGSTESRCVSGDELEMVYLEIEEPQAAPAPGTGLRGAA
ncbi:MAG: hydrogenase maturation nickel metallochaperone HypA [Acidobacteriia bacterium]|nr:hydrogenase maturation nickel metallochaperone HypA [Terriglobia bacterium]